MQTELLHLYFNPFFSYYTHSVQMCKRILKFPYKFAPNDCNNLRYVDKNPSINIKRRRDFWAWRSVLRRLRRIIQPVPIEFGDPASSHNFAQMFKSFVEIGISGFQLFEPLHQKTLRKLVQFHVETVQLRDFLLLTLRQRRHRRTGDGGIVLFEGHEETQVERLFEYVLGYFLVLGQAEEGHRL